MPVIPSVDAHVDIPFRAHHWHPRQSVSTSSSSTSLTPIIIPIVISILILIVSIVWRCAKTAQHSSHVAPSLVVEAPPGSRRGPVIAEILANSQAGAAAQDEGSPDTHATMSRSAPIDSQDPPGSIDEPSQPTQTNGPLSVNEDDGGSRASLDAGVSQAYERPRAVIIHQDAGHVPQVDEAEPIELPPPYASIPLA